MRVETELKLDFDDVLIRPKRSVAPSRASVDLQRSYRFRNASPAAGWNGTPIMAANLDTVGTMKMAQGLHGLHMLTCLHKYYPLEQLIDFFTTDPASPSAFYTLGIREEDFDKLQMFVKKAGDQARLICVDAANGYTKFFVDRVQQVRELCPGAILLAGNVATPEMVQELLIGGGADIVKVGIDPGSVCTTREMTGVGYPPRDVHIWDLATGQERVHLAGHRGAVASFVFLPGDRRLVSSRRGAHRGGAAGPALRGARRRPLQPSGLHGPHGGGGGRRQRRGPTSARQGGRRQG